MSGWFCDYEASKEQLIERVRSLREIDLNRSSTPYIKAHLEFAQHLEKTAEMFDEHRWMFLEEAVDRDPPQEIGLDGLPIPLHLSELRGGYFKITAMRLQEIAAIAREEAATYPDSRQRIALPFAAYGLLFIMYNCEKPRPRFSDNSPDVKELKQVCEAAGIVLSNTALRNALRKAWASFTPTICLSDGHRYDELLVYSQEVKLNEENPPRT